MYSENEIKALVAEKVEIYKRAKGDKKYTIPEYTEVYKESVEYYEQISVHAEIGKFPENIFKKRAPNQTPDEFEYMKANYETTTLPIWTRFVGVLNRMWNEANWSIEWGDSGQAKEGQDYIENKYPIYGSLEHYFKTIFTEIKAKDANAVICHKPLKLPVKKDANGDLMVDDTKKIEPVAIIYNSNQVVGFSDSEYAIIELKEKSVVEHGNGKRKSGLIYEFYDDENIYRIVQKGKEIDYEFDIILYWPHRLGYLPVMKLKGKPIQKETDILYQSPFMSAVGPMNLMLLDSSYLQASKAGHAFPHKWEYVDECDYSNGIHFCIGGRISNDGHEENCPSCKGSGYKSKSSVLGVTQIKVPKGTSSEDKISAPFVGWAEPDTKILDFLRSEIDKNEERALSILNLNVTTSNVKGSDTAFKTKTDREEMMIAIQGMSDETFNAFGFSIKCNLEMRDAEKAELPVITKPINFSIRNYQDITEELSEAKKNGLPDIAIRKLLLEYLATRFNTEKEATKVVDLAFTADRLITLSSLEIASKKLSGSVANYEDILHTSVWTFIDELAQDKTFFDKDIQEQKAAVVAMAKTKDAEISPKKLNTDAILANVNATAA